MSRIVITLNKTDIANILFGGEISMTPNVSKLDNLQQVIIKQEDYYNDCVVEEDWNDKERNVYQMHGNFTKV